MNKFKEILKMNCNKCNAVMKGEEMVYVKVGSKRYLRKRCRKCTREYHAKWRKEHFGYFSIAEQEKRRGCPIDYSKVKARQLLHNALNKMEIKKGVCEVCGSQEVQGHHWDYSKPLYVSWLCPTHHRRVHEKINNSLIC